MPNIYEPSNNHTENLYISHIQLPGVDEVFEIHDPKAIHSAADLGLSNALVFKGVLANKTALDAVTAPSVGDVYHVTDEDMEYVYTENGWEEFGKPADVYATAIHTHDITVNGSATVTGHNNDSEATVEYQKTTVASDSANVLKTASITDGSVNTDEESVVKSISAPTAGLTINRTADVAIDAPTAKAIVEIGDATKDDFITSVTPTNASVVNSVSSGSAEAVIGVSDEKGDFLTGVSASGTAKAITGLSTAKVNSASATDVSIPNVTNVGSASTWSFTVENGKLVIGGANSVAPTLGTAIAASKVATSEVEVATGASATADAITGLTPATAKALTSVSSSTANFVNSVSSTSADVVGSISTTDAEAVIACGTTKTSDFATIVSVSAQPTFASNDTFVTNVTPTAADVVKSVGYTAPVLTTTDASVVSTVTVGETTATASGTAKAQTWTQDTGNVSASGTTGTPEN